MKNIKEKYKIAEDSKFSLLELIIIVIAFSVVSGVLTGFVFYKTNDNNLVLDKNLKDIVNTYNKIKADYYGEVKLDDIADSAIDSMMNKLDERYSKFLDQESTNELNNNLNGTYQGIGISVRSSEGKIIILAVYDGTPAFKAGLKEGDIIVNINGKEITEDTNLEEMIKELKESNKTQITVKRNGVTITKKIDVTTIDTPVISKKIFERDKKKIGYIYIATFSSSSAKQFKTALLSLEEENIDSLIIDLRSNTGGYLQSAASIISMFEKKGDVMYALEDKNGKIKTLDITTERRNYDVVILTNQITASASEIITASLKENIGAIVVGTNTFGKGKVQETKTLSDKTMIKYTTASWYTPSGDSIDGIGIKPDIEVHLDEKYLNAPSDENDAQLQKAIEILSK